MLDTMVTKMEIRSEAERLGAKNTGFCSVDTWKEHQIQPEEYWPQTILPWARSVIVMGIPLYVPMVASTPSMIYQELYNTTNRILDDLAYRMTGFLVERGCRAMYFPRDGYSGMDALLRDPTAAFSHVLAAYYSGLGTIGDSHNLITPEYGPRVRIVSVVTDIELEPDPMMTGDLCIHCGRCLKECPAGCFTDDGHPYSMDMMRCTEHHVGLKRQGHWPCGMCIKVCPVGDDLRPYREIAPISPRGIEHCERKGSLS